VGKGMKRLWIGIWNLATRHEMGDPGRRARPFS
jgi:hypothetical protein